MGWKWLQKCEKSTKLSVQIIKAGTGSLPVWMALVWLLTQASTLLRLAELNQPWGVFMPISRLSKDLLMLAFLIGRPCYVQEEIDRIKGGPRQADRSTRGAAGLGSVEDTAVQCHERAVYARLVGTAYFQHLHGKRVCRYSAEPGPPINRICFHMRACAPLSLCRKEHTDFFHGCRHRDSHVPVLPQLRLPVRSERVSFRCVCVLCVKAIVCGWGCACLDVGVRETYCGRWGRRAHVLGGGQSGLSGPGEEVRRLTVSPYLAGFSILMLLLCPLHQY